METQTWSERPASLESFLWTSKVRRLVRKVCKWVLCIFIVSGLLLPPISSYLANTPHEREEIASGFRSRLTFGFNRVLELQWLKLFAPEPDPLVSPLPKAELFVAGTDLDSLLGHLPSSGSNQVEGQFRYKGDAYRVKARLRGDSINHWAFPYRSWRVRFRDGKEVDGFETMNLVLPRSSTQLENWLGYWMGREVGLFSPRADFVQFWLNREFNGVRLLTEQPNAQFFVHRGFQPSKVYSGDISTEQLYAGVAARPRLFSQPEVWSIDAPTLGEEVLGTEITSLVKALDKAEQTPAAVHEIEDLVHIDEVTRFMALLELVGSIHVDETHNQKFYLDPVSGLLRPIVWDTVAYLWGDKRELDLTPNRLFRAILNSDRYREMKDSHLYKMVTDTLAAPKLLSVVDSEVARIKPDMHSSIYKLSAEGRKIDFVSNSEWDDAIIGLRNFIVARDQSIRSRLQTNGLSGKIVRGQEIERSEHLALHIRSRARVEVKSITLDTPHLKDGEKVRLVPRLIEPPLPEGSDFIPPTVTAVVHGGRAIFAMPFSVLAARSSEQKRYYVVEPRTYFFSILGASDTRLNQVTALNALSGNPVELESPTAAEGEITKGLKAIFEGRAVDLSDVHAKATTPDPNSAKMISGDYAIKTDLIVRRGETLSIEPGTRVILSQGVSLIVDGGRLNIRGTKDLPVQFLTHSEADSWGSLIVRSSGVFTGENFVLKGGSRAVRAGVRYEGPLVVHGGVAIISNATIEGRVSFADSEVTLTDSVISTILPDPFTNFRSRMTVKGLVHQKVSPQITGDIITKEGIGTPPRIEHESKLAVVGNSADGTRALNAFAEAIRTRIAESLTHREQWKVPDLIGENFVPSERVTDFAFRDIHLDTEDRRLLTRDIGYRLRNRFDDIKTHNLHIQFPTRPGFFPTRLEFQGKVDRKIISPGVSDVMESRLEFRKQSAPFSDLVLPPVSPWPLRDYIPLFASGYFDGKPFYPAQQLAKALGIKPGDPGLSLVPSVVIVTHRSRQHLSIKTPWGSGPNSMQAVIITADRSAIYDPHEYLNLIDNRARPSMLHKVERGSLTEVEIEFERNVSTRLDQAILDATNRKDEIEVSKLRLVRDAFLSDLGQFEKIVRETAKDLGWNLQPEQMSKYAQSMAILGEKRSKE